MEHTSQESSSRKGKGGPKTAEGKARSALNAVTHGLTARAPVALWFESEEAWTTFRHGIVMSLSPVGASEQELAEKIALILWRQNRVAAYETYRTNLALAATPGEVERDLRQNHTAADAEARMRAKLTERLLLGEFELLKLQRYESHLGRELSRLFKHLHQLQDRRLAAARQPVPESAPPGSPKIGSEHPESPGPLTSPAPLVAAGPHAELPKTCLRTGNESAPIPGWTECQPFLQNELNRPSPFERLSGVGYGALAEMRRARYSTSAPRVRIDAVSWSGTSIPNASSQRTSTSTSCSESSKSMPKSVSSVNEASSTPYASATSRRTHRSIS